MIHTMKLMAFGWCCWKLAYEKWVERTTLQEILFIPPGKLSWNTFLVPHAGLEFLNSYHSLCTWKMRTVLWFLSIVGVTVQPFPWHFVRNARGFACPGAWWNQEHLPTEDRAVQRDYPLPSASLTLFLTKIESFGFFQGVMSRFSSS